MNRRNFVRRLSAITLLAGIAPAKIISARDYASFASQKLRLRFAVASDGHFGQADTPFNDYHDEMMGWLNTEHRNHPLDFCLFNGDLVHDDTTLFYELKSKYDHLEVPYHVSRGNHDRCDAETWRNAWGRDLNYSFEIGENGFIVLDTSNVKGEYLCPDIVWVKDALVKHRSNRNLFVFMHITPLKWTKNGIDCNKLVSMFGKQNNLRAVFHGHDHDQDSVKVAKRKNYFFDSHVGGNWGTDYRGYRIVEVTESNQILTYQVNPASRQRVNSNLLEKTKQ
jgi:3',5'-cyclic-AMP phosphodiesterase